MHTQHVTVQSKGNDGQRPHDPQPNMGSSMRTEMVAVPKALNFSRLQHSVRT